MLHSSSHSSSNLQTSSCQSAWPDVIRGCSARGEEADGAWLGAHVYIPCHWGSLGWKSTTAQWYTPSTHTHTRNRKEQDCRKSIFSVAESTGIEWSALRFEHIPENNPQQVEVFLREPQRKTYKDSGVCGLANIWVKQSGCHNNKH